MRGNIFGVEFEREAANGTTVLAVGGHQALPIGFEQPEDALDRLIVGIESRTNDQRLE